MKNNYSNILKDIIQLIDEFLKQEITSRDIRRWIKNHPIKKSPNSNEDIIFIKNNLSIINRLSFYTKNPKYWLKLKNNITNYLAKH